jgi:hypothetical protein
VLSGGDLDELADKVVSRLNGSVISSAFPAFIGRYIQNTLAGHSMMWSHWLQLRGPDGIQATYIFEVDGVMRLELADSSGCIFWRGTFRPEESADADA